MSQKLNELLTASFRFDEGTLFDSEKRVVWLYAYNDQISGLKNTLGGIIATTLNEKWERGFGEPLSWIESIDETGFTIECPYCGAVFFDGTKPFHFNFCPRCGRQVKHKS